MSKRERDYLFIKPGSKFWRVRFQADGKSTERSLGTTDRDEAERLAWKAIGQHRAAVAARRPHARRVEETELQPRPEPYPGREPDELDFATSDQIITMKGGVMVGTRPNRQSYTVISPPTKLTWEAIDKVLGVQPAAPKKDPDDALFDRYIEKRAITGPKAAEARAVYAMYKAIIGKPFKDAGRLDGERLAMHYVERGDRGATVKKKIGWLTAAINLAIKDDVLHFNPFSGVVPSRKWFAENKPEGLSVKRLPLSEEDMTALRSNISALSSEDVMLFELLARTGMRPSEAYQIREEFNEAAIRYVIVGAKTDSSERRVPIDGLLPAVTGQVFDPTDLEHAGRRLNKWIRETGITDPRKVLYSTRHRAKDRLRAASCPLDIQYSLLGHEEKTVAAGYGVGHPVSLLKEWQAKIN